MRRSHRVELCLATQLSIDAVVHLPAQLRQTVQARFDSLDELEPRPESLHTLVELFGGVVHCRETVLDLVENFEARCDLANRRLGFDARPAEFLQKLIGPLNILAAALQVLETTFDLGSSFSELDDLATSLGDHVLARRDCFRVRGYLVRGALHPVEPRLEASQALDFGLNPLGCVSFRWSSSARWIP